ncbi:MAG: 2,3-bisphosphoglycerate-independent phosphoglycerate mutase [Bacteroidales bacterium]|nr:2,3-bisphosphoglycerate-independent phosphoglycerate mutase [Bacteroidales bacterium]
MKNRVLLMILDGWGLGDETGSDVIASVPTPNMDRLSGNYPSSRLLASGKDVGLPDGQMGNSEVGHLNIGAGRIVYQDLVKINRAIEKDELKKNKELVEAFMYARENGKQVHFLGLLSDGGVHSLNKHLYALCDITQNYGLDKVFVHAFGDGRDTDPRSGKGFLKELMKHISKTSVQVASFVGRYYAMDRDKRWERIKIAYDLLTKGEGKKTKDMPAALQESYDEDVTDEFIKAIVHVDESGKPVGTLEEGDVVIFINFRNDRAKELTIVLSQKDMPEHGMKTIPLYYCTMTPYDAEFEGLKILFPKENVTNTIGQVLSEAGLSQLRIAETEKYAHVTFFFSGGREEKFRNESRVLIPSPGVATYDLKPEMSAFEVKDAVISEIKKEKHDFICLNFANCDMVGHTGVYESIRKAIKAVDRCVGEVVQAAVDNGYEVLIIADHGNADNAVNPDGSPNTAHSLNPVPCILVSDRYSGIREGILADVAPTILSLMDLEAPQEMTGKSFISR